MEEMIVKFSTICDKCRKRSEEYTSYPHCRECGEDVCVECRSTDWDDPEKNTGICKECAIGKN